MKKFVSKMLAGALGLSMLCGVAAAEGETYVSWYTFGDVYLSSVRTALDAAMEAKGLTVVDKDSNANQQTQTDDINTALVTGANAVVVNMVESGAIGTAETLMNAIKEKDVPAVFFNRAVSTDNNEAAELFKGYEKSAFIGTDFTQAGIMQGKMIGEYVLEHFDEIDLNHDGKISYVMFKGDEANQEAIARTKYGVECADEVLTAAGKPALEFYDASNANKYLVDLNGTWSNTASFDYMQTILAQYNEANNNMVEVVICNNDDMAIGVVIGAAFGKITTSIVNDIIMPLIGLLTGGIDLAKWNILLNSAAVEAGADPVTLGIGNLLAVILDFIIVAFAMFLLVKGMNKLASLKKKEEEPAPEEEPKPTSEDLLTEIRDLLKEQQK